jgi:phage terminase small subunit
MAKPGPKLKPIVLKLAAGNPGRRPLNEREPQPTSGIPDAPEWLDDVDRACWMRTAGELHKLGVLTLIDGDAPARLLRRGVGL